MVVLWRIEDEPDGRRAILAQAARHCNTSPPASTLAVFFVDYKIACTGLKLRRRGGKNEMLKTEFDWTEQALSQRECANN